MKCVHNILFTDFMIYEKLINDIHLYTILSYAQKNLISNTIITCMRGNNNFVSTLFTQIILNGNN